MSKWIVVYLFEEAIVQLIRHSFVKQLQILSLSFINEYFT
jgi:hypothetical protein